MSERAESSPADEQDRTERLHRPEHDDHVASTEDTGTVIGAPIAETQDVSDVKTSAAAAFALVFGVAALFAALTLILSPVAVVLGLIGVIVGVIGLSRARRPLVTGRGVAMGGLILSLIGLLLGAAVIGGAANFVSNEDNVQRIEDELEELRSNFPTQLPSEVTD